MLTRFEHIPVRIVEDHATLARAVARRMAEVIRERASRGVPAVLGLATGSTPVGIYRELIRMHREEGLDFSHVVTFNLDEYVPMRPDSIHSYHRFMRENLFDHVNVPEGQIRIPRGDLAREGIDQYCAAYEQAIRDAGGIDFQLLGIGRSGHIGFNEPGSAVESRTRLVYLDTVTRADAASDFFGEENVPPEAVTMGVATILETREIALIATGEHKSAIVRRAVEGPVHADVAATYLQKHPNATAWLDPAAAAELTRVSTPWLVGEVEWTPDREADAVLWVSRRTNKPILHLANRDYRDHHLSSLVARHGHAEPLNGEIFNRLIAKIRGKSKLPAGERIVVFSPHPDDDVISMGGTLRKLVQNGNEVTVAYQTSGNIAVFDHEVRRYLDFVERARRVLSLSDYSALSRRVEGIETDLARKAPGEVDAADVRELKRVIRETEAVSALQAVGLGPEQARFLDLPFYQTGRVRKDPIGEHDVEIVRALLEEIRPSIVFAAGDLSDPHGTHRMCLEAIQRALDAGWAGGGVEGGGTGGRRRPRAVVGGTENAGAPLDPQLWLYRGAWQEWSLVEADVLVPMSADELRRKVLAIFKHQSQKDVAPFPGPDPREFWQRVEDRNRATAEALRAAGLPAYYAVEAFVVLERGERLRPTILPTSELGEG
jgi:glucosamine-6-phosphate deaminase